MGTAGKQRRPGQRELISLYRVEGLHRERERAQRTGQRFIVAARSAAGAAVLLGLMAGVLLWCRPSLAGQQQALIVGGVALGLGTLWVVVLWRAARWLNDGMPTDSGSKPETVAAGLEPNTAGDPEGLWNMMRIAHLVLLCVPVAGLVLTLAGAMATTEQKVVGWDATRWWITGFILLVTGLMGGTIGGLASGMVNSSNDCWTPRGAARRLLVYAVPFLLAAPWLTGLHTGWSGALAGAAALWLLIGPVEHVAKHIPGSSAD
ncbi:hypothetical protein AB0I66_35910 [Streptomyces sp. NPDC050439]|uniref:hypothetical protein n=1 Tax=unclassified Streptomyces TaxID=2593676 RepID=UPI00343F0988